jgi:tetratricopeptide (TPR) repeat protein
MKKVMILLAIVLTANVMMAQKKDRTDAFMYNKNGQYEKAMVSIEKCVNHEQFLGQKPEWQAEAWLYRAVIYQNVLQSNDEALKAKAPDALEIVYESLMKCMENESFLNENKQDIYQRVGSVMTAYYTKGADAYNAGDFAAAAPLFKKAYDIAKQLGTNDANDMLNLAATSGLRAGDYATALAYFTELKDNGVDTADTYRHLAACYTGTGNTEMAMQMINAGLEKDPSNGQLILEKVNAYLKEGKGAEAIEDLDKLKELDPNNASLYFVLGTIYGDEEKEVYDADKAVENYTHAIEINPDYFDAIYNLGALYITMSNKLKAQANEITGFSKAEIAQYDELIAQAEELLRTGLPYVEQAYRTQPTEEVKSVLKTMYVQLNMTEEAKALEEQ